MAVVRQHVAVTAALLHFVLHGGARCLQAAAYAGA